MTGPFIAIDWGTTNRRCYLIGKDGAVAQSLHDDRGVIAMAADGYPAELAAIRATLGDHPVLIAGMAGSNRGWRNVPYRACPAGLSDLAGGIAWIEPGRTGIIPGLSCSDPRPDVMRGEEVQILGAVATWLVAGDATVCQPGTHAKWVEVADSRITRFATAMTGEMFALLRQHGLLAPQIAGVVRDNAAFREGVREARQRDLLGSLFTIRARGLLDPNGLPDAASFASGLVIGSDVVARDLGRPIDILADEALGLLYKATIETLGGTGRIVDCEAAFVAGMTALWSRL